MKNAAILIIFILLGAILTLWLDNASPPEIKSVPITAQERVPLSHLPDFEITDINGKLFRTSENRGEKLILNFWATWCAPCVVEFPKLVKLAKDNPEITILFLSSDANQEAISRFLEKQSPETKETLRNKNIIVAKDNKGKITADIFQTYKLPETLIISSTGTLAHKIVGDTDWNGEEIKSILRDLD